MKVGMGGGIRAATSPDPFGASSLNGAPLASPIKVGPKTLNPQL